MFKNKCIVSIGNLLTNRLYGEQKNGIVHLPSNTDYYISLKNENSFDLFATISIDDEVVNTFKVDKFSTIDIKRFVDKNNLNEGKSFKFVQLDESDKTTTISKQKNGIVRVEWYRDKRDVIIEEYKERLRKIKTDYDKLDILLTEIYGGSPWVLPILQPLVPHYWNYEKFYVPAIRTFKINSLTNSGTLYKTNATLNSFDCSTNTASYSTDSSNIISKTGFLSNSDYTLNGSNSELNFTASNSSPRQTESTGKTIEGEIVKQSFSTVVADLEDTPFVIIEMKMLVEVVTAKTFCTNCGSKIEPEYKFCASCGTKL